jgi:hypothetical protein
LSNKDDDKEQRSAEQNLNAKDYVALAIAMAESVLLPQILLIIVLAALGIFISILLFH